VSTKLVIMAGLAVAFGATSYVAGNHYLDSQTQARLSQIENDREKPVVQEVEMASIVVAGSAIGFGEALTSETLDTIDWPTANLPDGAFTSIEDLTATGSRRALSSFAPGELILSAKLSGENARAGLAGIIGEGMRAVTIPVNSIAGVAGFVQPGDRVDVMLTKELNNDDIEDREATTRVILQNVKVLSVDQEAGDRLEVARLAETVTIEVDANGAKRVALALNLGDLSLLLRSMGDEDEQTASAKMSDFQESSLDDLFSLEAETPKTTTIRVVAGEEEKSFTVDIESAREPQNGRVN